MAEKIGMHFSLVSGSVIAISFSCLLVCIQSSSYSGLCGSLLGVWISLGEFCVLGLSFFVGLNSLVSLRLTRRVREFVTGSFACVRSPAFLLFPADSGVEYRCSGLSGLEGDDVIAARISLEVARSFLGDS